jgi:hypothetical protein
MQPDLFTHEDAEPVTLWQRLGAWMLGECEKPEELDEVRDAE